MNQGGDTADQMVRMSLQGIEIAANIALKVGGDSAKSLAATLYAIITDNKKIKGKTRLDTLLKSNKELKIFAIHHNDLKAFCEQAKRYGVLYSVLKEKNKTNGIVEIMVRAEDAAKLTRIIDKLELATINTQAIKESILAQKETKDIPLLSEQEHDKLLSKLMEEQNPKEALMKSDSPLEHSCKKQSVATNSSTDRPSVRNELNNIKKEMSSRVNKKDKSKSQPKKRISR